MLVNDSAMTQSAEKELPGLGRSRSMPLLQGNRGSEEEYDSSEAEAEESEEEDTPKKIPKKKPENLTKLRQKSRNVSPARNI